MPSEPVIADQGKNPFQKMFSVTHYRVACHPITAFTRDKRLILEPYRWDMCYSCNPNINYAYMSHIYGTCIAHVIPILTKPICPIYVGPVLLM